MRKNPTPQLCNGYFTKNKKVNFLLDTLNVIGKLALFARRKGDVKTENILIVDFGGFGDGLMLTSVLGSFRLAFPHSRIDLVCNEDIHKVVMNNKNLDNIYTQDSRFYKKYFQDIFRSVDDFRKISIEQNIKYDAAFCLRSFMDNGILPLFLSRIATNIIGFKTGGFAFAVNKSVDWQPGKHETDHYLDVLRSIEPKATLGKMEIFYDRECAQAELGPLQARFPYAVIHMGSKDRKRVPDDKRIDDILRWFLKKTSLNVVLTGTKEEAEIWVSTLARLNKNDASRVYSTHGKLSLYGFIEALRQATAIVTVETFAAHLGACFDIPTVSYWSGVTDPRQWRPLGKTVDLYFASVPCAPCFRPCEGMECMQHDVLNALDRSFAELKNS